MGSHDKVDFVQQIELIHHFVPENPPCSSGISSPGLNVLRIRPHQVGHGPLVGDFLLPIEESHLVDRRQVRRESSVHAQHVAIDYGSEGQEIESLVEVFPAVRVSVLFVDLVQEAIHHSHVPAFVISSQKIDPVGIFDFEAKQQCNRLDRVVASVHKVSDHYELALRHSPSVRQQVFYVVKLAMDISGEEEGGFN